MSEEQKCRDAFIEILASRPNWTEDDYHVWQAAWNHRPQVPDIIFVLLDNADNTLARAGYMDDSSVRHSLSIARSMLDAAPSQEKVK